MTALALLADIGGTNTRVALADDKVVRKDSIAKFPNADYKARGQDIAHILRDYLNQAGLASVDGVCVAAAGPVRDGVATMTNLDWSMDAAKLSAATGASKVAILNDLQAQGHALGHIAAENLRTVIDGPVRAGGSMLVVGLGTGVNAAPVHETPWGRVVPPSECGHITMPVRTEEDLRLAHFVEKWGEHAHGFAGVEDVLAGRGLEHLYAFVTSEAGAVEHKSSAEIMTALAAGEPHARATARIYIRILGQELGNLALIHLPFGGIYLIGGMSRALTPWFDEMGLSAAFKDKGRFADFMNGFSVSVVEDDYAALTGCAAYLSNGGKG
jgi:glucokinase